MDGDFEVGEEILELTDEQVADRGDVAKEEGSDTDDHAAGSGEEAGEAGDSAGAGDEKPEGGKGEEGKGEEHGKEGHEPETVPYARFKEKVGQHNRTKEELDALKEQNRILNENLALMKQSAQPKAAEDEKEKEEKFDLAGKMTEYNRMIIDGDDEGATRLFGEILDYQNQVAEQRAEKRVTETFTRKEQEAAHKQNLGLANEIVKRNQDALEAEPELAYDIAYFRAKFERQGMNVSEALLAAEKKVFGPKAEPEQDVDTIGKKSPAELAREKQKRDTITKNADAANRQPPPMNGGRGQRESKQTTNALEMSDEEFDKLPEAEKQKKRGDVI
jgi:hypothetical protein